MHAAEEPFAPWGTFDLLYASPEVVAAALGLTHMLNADTSAQPGTEADDKAEPDGKGTAGSGGATAAASADVWSLGLVLFEATVAAPYWPPHFALLDIVQALLGFTSLPHEANPHMLDSCGELAPVVGRMLARDAPRRPSLLEIGELAGNCVMDALVGFQSAEVRAAPQMLHVPGHACLAPRVRLPVHHPAALGLAVEHTRQQAPTIASWHASA